MEGDHMRTIQEYVAKWGDDPFIGNIVREVGEIAEKYGVDDLPIGPDIQVKGEVFSRATDADVGDWGGKEAAAAEEYNLSLDIVFEMIDYRYIGSGIWYTTAHSPESEFPEHWDEYQEEAEAAINAWVHQSAWDTFTGLDPDLL